MKGHLIRESAKKGSGNAVRVEFKVVGSKIARCEVCKMDTSTGVLEAGFTFCGLCGEVTSPPDAPERPCELCEDEHE